MSITEVMGRREFGEEIIQDKESESKTIVNTKISAEESESNSREGINDVRVFPPADVRKREVIAVPASVPRRCDQTAVNVRSGAIPCGTRRGRVGGRRRGSGDQLAYRCAVGFQNERENRKDRKKEERACCA